MAKTLISAPEGGLFPAGLTAFLKRRMAEGVGIACAGLALAHIATLISYSPVDPSLNNATDQAVTNYLGLIGAIVADVSLQTLGISAAIPAIILLTWAFRLIRKRPLGGTLFRLSVMVGAVTLSSVAVAAINTPASWPLVAGLGGFTGDALLDHIRPLATYVHPDYGLALAAALLGGLAAFMTVYALGCTREDWAQAARGLSLAFRRLRAGLGLPGTAAGRLEELRARFLQDGDGDEELARHDKDIKPANTKPRVRKSKDVADPLVEDRKRRLKTGQKADRQRQKTLNLGEAGVYSHPPLDLLEESEAAAPTRRIDKDLLEQNARFLASVLEDFGVRGEIVKVRPGPVVTLYELEPAPGTKTARVIGLSDDIARSMSAISVRVAVVPGRSVIGIELPNSGREMVGLRELLASEAFEKTAGDLPLALGKDIGGAPVCVDLAKMPHLLIAGTTGSGKSVGMNAMILSLLYRLKPEACKFIMIDPKMLELSVYDGIPHLLTPVVTDPSKAVVALKWTVREMEDRYRAMSQVGVRNIAGFNARLIEARKHGETLTRKVQTGFDDDGLPVYEEQPIANEPLAHIVVVVDEMADLMLVAGKDVEAAIQRLAQMARAAGIHLIMATQRPSVDVITGTIKANFPTRISFQVTSKIDSRTILGEQGAENLLGQGDMLYMAGGGRISRVHGPFVSDEDVEQVVKFLLGQGVPDYIDAITIDDEGGAPETGGGRNQGGDALYDEAVALVAREGKASTSFIQRHLQIGYNRAARIIEQMESEGVVSPANRVGRREVLIGSH